MKNKNKKTRKSDAPYALRRGKKPSHQRGDARRVRNNGRRSTAERGDVFSGVFRSSGKGYGFIVPSDGGEDFFVPPPYVGSAMDGDTVKARRLFESGGRGSEAAVTEVTARGRDFVIGTLCTDGLFVWVESDDGLVKGEVTSFAVEARTGDKVELSILSYPDEYRERTVYRRHKRGGKRSNSREDRVILTVSGEVSRTYGDSESREANYASILRQCGIRTEFPPEVLAEAAARSRREIVPDGREDLRGETIFTIDGADAKDLDDAISASRTEEGYLLGVHIADVSHYVTAESAVDREALERGTSVYFIDQVVPMLPKELSNGACSLNAGEDKYALSAFIRISREGDILGYEFKKSLIRSKVRGVYSEVNDLFERGDASPFAEKYGAVRDTLAVMRELYLILLERSRQRGALELDAPEAQIVMGEDGLPETVVPRVRGDGERMIEQFMLCANVAAASFTENADLSGVYRIHQPPDPEKIRSFVLFSHNAGLDVSPLGEANDGGVSLTHTPGTREISAILSEAEEKGIGDVISSVMLRSMMKAKYQVTPSPHFGLALPLYCHFTSPIRRYPDLFVHRAISARLEGRRPPSFERAMNAAALSSERELAAQRAEREIEDLYLTLWMSRHIGEEFDAQITGVCRSGFFARTAMLCEGFVPEESLGRITDYSESSFTLSVTGRAGERVFRLGDSVRVRAVSADVISGKITFHLAD